MNCKPGDLVLIVRSGPRTTRLVGRVAKLTKLEELDFKGRGPVWGYEPPLFKTDDALTTVTFLNDMFLRPIRDQPGEDEILRIAGKPCDIKTPEAA